MYNHKLILTNQMFEAGKTIPANTSADASTAGRAGGTKSRLAVTVTAATATSIDIGKQFILTLKECATETGTFVTPGAAPSMTVTYAAATDFAVGERIASLVLPENIGKWVKARVATNDAAATGTLNIFLEYLGA